jgi:hypothetical protein
MKLPICGLQKMQLRASWKLVRCPTISSNFEMFNDSSGKKRNFQTHDANQPMLSLLSISL